MNTTDPKKLKAIEQRKKRTPALLAKIGETPKAIARQLGVNYWTVLRWAKGTHAPHVRLFADLQSWAKTGQPPA